MNKIKELRVSHNLSQQKLANILNVHQTAVSQWEKGRTCPDMEILKKIADFFNVSVDYLLGREEKQISMIGNAVVAEAYDTSYGEEETPDFYFVFQGDSMINAHILNGDTVYVKEIKNNIPLVNNRIYAVKLNGETTLKRVFQKDSFITLTSENPAYEPIILNNNDYNDFKVLGNVVGIRREIK